MIINKIFFLEVHSYLKKIAIDIIIPKIGKLREEEVSTKIDNSKVTSYDVIIENELINYFKNFGFKNIISEEGNSDLIKKNEYLTVDPLFFAIIDKIVLIWSLSVTVITKSDLFNFISSYKV